MSYYPFVAEHMIVANTDTICKNCKFNGGKPSSPYCDKYMAGDFTAKPREVNFAKGKGKCKYFEKK